MLKASEKKLMEKWKDTPVGTEVILTRDNGKVVHTKTRSNAEILSGHSAVIWLEGVAGCYSLRNVRLAPSNKGGTVMDRASQIAQEAVSYAVKEGRRMGHQAGPPEYEASFAEHLRKHFPVTKRKAREPRGRARKR